uniref:Uncharacterized protein n=1 Tax=Salix viminalis TaxID=40686 RepID=A0A6N2MVU0_SALVM
MESKIPENFESGHGRPIAAPAKGFQLLETLSEFDCLLRHLVLQFIASARYEMAADSLGFLASCFSIAIEPSTAEELQNLWLYLLAMTRGLSPRSSELPRHLQVPQKGRQDKSCCGSSLDLGRIRKNSIEERSMDGGLK